MRQVLSRLNLLSMELYVTVPYSFPPEGSSVPGLPVHASALPQSAYEARSAHASDHTSPDPSAVNPVQKPPPVSYVFDLNIIAMLINNAFKMTVIENVRYRIEKRRD